MALQYKPTAVNDNGSNRWNELANNASRDAQYGGTAAQQAIQRDLERQRELEALEAKKRQEEAEDREARLAAARERANAAAANSGRANAQQSYATASGRTGTTPAPISYNANQWAERPEEEQTTAAPYAYRPAAATAPAPETEERDASFFNLRPTPYVDVPTPTPAERATPTAADTTETTTAARRSGEYRAEAQAPIVYTGGQATGINKTAGQTAAGTKDALTEAGDEEAEWMRQALQAAAAAGLNGTAAEEFANQLVAQRRITNQTPARRTGEERAEAQAPTGSRPVTGAQTTPAITWGGSAQPAANGTAAGTPASSQGSATPAGLTFEPLTTTEAIAAGVQQSIRDYQQEQAAATEARRAAIAGQRQTAQRAADQAAAQQDAASGRGNADLFFAAVNTNPDLKNYYDDLVYRAKETGMAQTDQEAQAYAIRAMAPEMGYNANAIVQQTGVPASYYQPAETKSSQEKYQERNRAYQDSYDSVIRNGGTPAEAEAAGIAAARAVQQRQEEQDRAGVESRTSNETGSSGQDSRLSNISRQGAAEEVATWEASPSDPRENMQQTYTTESGKTYTTPAASQAGSQSNNQNGNTANTKGATYFDPSYGQGGKGVKLPYKKGGYTAEEIEKAGNNSWGTEYGNKVYEGYYLAPDGKYYPVDQEKAAYYIRNGYSYDGWEEPMRDYYNTFGTFYGYRPDWKQAGRNVSNYSYSPRSYSSSGSGRSYGRSYGSGSTPNNGLYFNGITSWSI